MPDFTTTNAAVDTILADIAQWQGARTQAKYLSWPREGLLSHPDLHSIHVFESARTTAKQYGYTVTIKAIVEGTLYTRMVGYDLNTGHTADWIEDEEGLPTQDEVLALCEAHVMKWIDTLDDQLDVLEFTQGGIPTLPWSHSSVPRNGIAALPDQVAVWPEGIQALVSGMLPPTWMVSVQLTGTATDWTLEFRHEYIGTTFARIASSIAANVQPWMAV